MNPRRSLGDVLTPLILWLWMTIAVGPWWVGLLIFAAVWLLNIIGSIWRPR